MDLSWKPTRMNASTFSTNTATSHTAYDGMRMRAGMISAARRDVAIAKTTIVMMPERCSRSARIQTANVPQNWNTTAVATSLIRPLMNDRRAREHQPEHHAAERDHEQHREHGQPERKPVTRRADREAVDEQRARVVEEALAFEDHEQPVRRAKLLEHRRRRRGVGRRDDRAERDRGRPRHVGHQHPRDDRDDDDRERDRAERQARDRAPVRAQVARRGVERGVEQHGRDEQRERELGIEHQRRHAGDQRQRGAGERHQRRDRARRSAAPARPAPRRPAAAR